MRNLSLIFVYNIYNYIKEKFPKYFRLSNSRRPQGDSADIQCPQAAQRKQARHACLNIFLMSLISRIIIPRFQLTGGNSFLILICRPCSLIGWYTEHRHRLGMKICKTLDDNSGFEGSFREIGVMSDIT